MLYFLVPEGDAWAPSDYIRRAGIEDRASVITFEEILDLDALPFGGFVYAGINRLGPAMAAFLAAVADHVEEATGLAPLNHPTKSLRRYELIRALYDRGMIPYTAYGAWEDFDEVRFPAFVRPREEDSYEPQLRESLRGLQKDIGHHLLDGRGPEEIVVIEYADTAVDGDFTKYSAYGIGRQIVATSLDRGRFWAMRRSYCDIDFEMLADEERYVLESPHEEALREVFDLAHIGFGRIDYSMLDGQLVCWEINTLPLLRRPPGVQPLPPELEKARDGKRRQFAKRYGEAFEAVLVEVERAQPRWAASNGDSIPLPELTDLREGARAEVRDRGVTAVAGPPKLDFLRTLLRPLKPVLTPVASAVVFPILAARARRRNGSNGP